MMFAALHINVFFFRSKNCKKELWHKITPLAQNTDLVVGGVGQGPGGSVNVPSVPPPPVGMPPPIPPPGVPGGPGGAQGQPGGNPPNGPPPNA